MGWVRCTFSENPVLTKFYWSFASCLALLALNSCQMSIRGVSGDESKSYHWTFDALDGSSYLYPTSIDFSGGTCKLAASDQIDNDNSSSGFAGGTLNGVTFDASNSTVRLTQSAGSTNLAELDSSWAPKYSSLVGYWKLNGAAGVVANGTSVPAAVGAAGSAFNADSLGMSFVSGQLREAVTFSGTNEALAFGDSLDPVFVGPNKKFTISAWIKPVSTTNNEIVCKFAGGAFGENQREFEFLLDTGNLGFVTYGGLTAANMRGARGSSLLTDPTHWYYVVVTYDGTIATGNGLDRVSLYVDGKKETTTAFNVAGAVPDISDGTAPLAFGASVSTAGTGATYAYTGQIDEVAIWNAVLTPTEVAAIHARQSAKYSGTFTSRVMDAVAPGMSWTKLSWTSTLPFFKEMPDYASGSIQNEASTDYPSLVGSGGTIGDNNLMSGILGLWHLNEAVTGTAPSATDFKDDSGKNLHGTQGGMATFGSPGKFGLAAEFDGLDDRINLGTASVLDDLHFNDFTISAWIRDGQTGNNTWGGIYSSYLATKPGVSFRTNSDGSGNRNLNLTVNYSLTEATAGTTFGSIKKNQWHHVVGRWIRSTQTLKLYIDGVEAGYSSQVASAGSIGTDAGNQKWIGGLPNGGSGLQTFLGSIDEVAIWSRALDPKEVLQLYRRGANRVKQQVRICTASDCSDDATGAAWKGPDGTNQTFFSELNNNTVQLTGAGDVSKGSPAMLFSAFTSPIGTSRYFQYRTILESDDPGSACNYGSGATWCSPELKSVTVDPVHYDPGSPAIIGKTAIEFTQVRNFTETLGSSCAGGTGFNLSYDRTLWYYWNGSAWAVSSGVGTQSNDAATIALHANTFVSAGNGVARPVFFKAYLKSNGLTPCELSEVAVTGLAK
jgi:hypothetical protein